jgi:hypothetical protein
MPLWLFQRFVGPDLPTMWRWLHDNDVAADPAETSAIVPTAATVREWISRATGRTAD